MQVIARCMLCLANGSHLHSPVAWEYKGRTTRQLPANLLLCRALAKVDGLQFGYCIPGALQAILHLSQNAMLYSVGIILLKVDYNKSITTYAHLKQILSCQDVCSSEVCPT